MRFFDKFKRKKKEEIPPKGEVKKPTELELLCRDDEETYEALLDTMFLDPRKIGISMEEVARKAKDFEKSGDLRKARMNYEIAGGLAIYEGNVKKVIEFFSECQKISPDKKYPILKISEKAISKAQEYYKKYLKEEKKK